MSIPVTCLGCDREQRVLAEAVGKAVRCRYCATKFVAQPATAVEGDDIALVLPVDDEPPGHSVEMTAQRPGPPRQPPAARRLRHDSDEPIRAVSLPRYGRPWYLFVLALLPLSMPAHAAIQSSGLALLTGWGLLVTGLAVCLSLAALGISLRRGLPVWVRALTAAGLTLTGYVVVTLMALAFALFSVLVRPSDSSPETPPRPALSSPTTPPKPPDARGEAVKVFKEEAAPAVKDHPTLFDVNGAPELYEGKTLVFEPALLFGVVIGRGDQHELQVFNEKQAKPHHLMFRVSRQLASQVTAEGLGPSYHPVKLTCMIEKVNGRWHALVQEVVLLDSKGMAIQVLK